MTLGHVWMIKHGVELTGGHLTIAIGVNPAKKPLFSLEKRLELLRAVSKECRDDYGAPPEVTSYENMFLVNYARQIGAEYILRGIRNQADAKDEQAMRNINQDLAPEIQTIFLMPPRELCEVSSSFVKGLVGPEGWRDVVSRYVSPEVLVALEERLDPKPPGTCGSSSCCAPSYPPTAFPVKGGYVLVEGGKATVVPGSGRHDS